MQKQILDELRAAESLRYNELNKSGVESGHFRYHLGQLVKDGYVGQLNRGEYALTTEGQQFTDRLSEHRVNPHEMPKVITYTLLINDQTVYLCRKPKQPYKDLLNMVGGKLHAGETAHQSSVREVQEKTGLHIAPPDLADVVEILVKQNGSIFTHVIAYIFIASIKETIGKGHNVEAFARSELENREDLAPDFLPIFNKIMDKKPALGTLIIETETGSVPTL